MHLVNLFQWLNDSPFSVWLREGDWPFPIVETVHILGLSLSVGTIMWIDLRLLGLVTNRYRASEVVGQLEPWAIRGFGVMFVSGLFLFLAEPMKCYTALSFRLKAIMLVLAGLNVLYFHARVSPYLAEWEETPVLPWRPRMVGVVSLVLWFGIIIAGRWTAYL
jgi:Family of unknown function (DUF6644)